MKNIKKQKRKFKKQLKWFLNKVLQSSFFEYLEYPYNYYSKNIDYVFNKLYLNYKPYFKKHSQVKFFYTDKDYYVFSYSFTDNKFNTVKEENADMIVFRITKKFNNKNKTLYRYFIKLK